MDGEVPVDRWQQRAIIPDDNADYESIKASLAAGDVWTLGRR
jgi:hypothetical protein